MKMARFVFRFAVLLALTCLLVATPLLVAAPALEARVSLHGAWQMQSSCEDKSAGNAISATGYAAKGWRSAAVPGTVVGALVADKTLPDPDYGINLKSFPGFSSAPEGPFSNRDMPADSPYRCSFWFRTEFATPTAFSGKAAWLHFLGINYRANIWLNGKKIADRAEVAGAYRSYEFRITDLLNKSGENALALEVFAPEKNDLGLTWVDWNPTPPDKDMGIWREVFLTASREVALRHPFVRSKLGPDYNSAELTLSAELRNITDHPLNAVLHADLDTAHVSQPVALAASETKIVRFSPDQFPQLKLSHPRLWWPYQMGEPHLYTAKFRVETGKDTSDEASVDFGIREVTSELTDKGHRLFKVNGKNVLIRGAAWAPDMLLRWSSKRLDADLAYTKHMGLNAIRLEGKTDRDEFFDKTDRLGILVMPGWICCDAWEQWENWTPETKKIAAASLTDQIFRQRNAHLGHRKVRRQNDRSLRIRSAYVLARRQRSGRSVRLQHRDQPRPGHSSQRKPRQVHSERPPLAHRRLLEFPRGRRTLHHREHILRSPEQALRPRFFPRRLRTQGTGYGLRQSALHVRGLWQKQVHLHWRDSVDAQQRVAFPHLAPLRLLPRARGRLLRHSKSLGNRPRPIQSRR